VQVAGDRDLRVEPVNFSCSFTLQESSFSKVDAGSISLSSEFSSTTIGAVKFNTEKTLSAEFIFIGSPYNLVLIEPQSYDSVFLTSFAGNKTHNIEQLLQAESTVSVTGGMIYDLVFLYTWNSFNLNTFFTQGYVVEGFHPYIRMQFESNAGIVTNILTR
jgi:hypothetical protein